MPISAIRGVLSLLPRVAESELTQIMPTQRPYVAAEMMAFLVAWLASLPCVVLNQPTPLNLTGPSWYPEQWVREARRAGLQTRECRRLAAVFADDNEPVPAADRRQLELPGNDN